MKGTYYRGKEVLAHSTAVAAREVRDRESSEEENTPDFGGGGEPVAPGPIVGASGPTETEGGAPEGGAESGPAEPEGREAAEEGGSTEAAEGPRERVALGVVPRRGPYPVATSENVGNSTPTLR